ncbi:MAG: radical SAM protein [Elusimicrobia bacterium]|nr:radical SAM protein [Elusimicrobiota bacterium]
MLKDRYGGVIDYARISLTDRCNIACRYCMTRRVGGDEGSRQLSFGQIYFLIDILKGLGIKKFRFTGGEPFAREGVTDFLERLDPASYWITTNFSVEGIDVERINRTGLSGVNVSLDTLDPEKYRWITRGGDLGRVIGNLRALKKTKKINTVVIKDFNENEITDIIRFSHGIGAVPRLIEKMNIIDDGLGFVGLDGVVKKLVEDGVIEDAGIAGGGSVAKYYRMKNGSGRVGFITPISGPFCEDCNKIRIKSDGELRLCLFSREGLDIRQLIESGKKKEDIETQIKNFVAKKPVAWDTGMPCEQMAEIGG